MSNMASNIFRIEFEEPISEIQYNQIIEDLCEFPRLSLSWHEDFDESADMFTLNLEAESCWSVPEEELKKILNKYSFIEAIYGVSWDFSSRYAESFDYKR